MPPRLSHTPNNVIIIIIITVVALHSLAVLLRSSEWPDHSTTLRDRWVASCRDDLRSICPRCADQSSAAAAAAAAASSACDDLRSDMRVPLTLASFAQLLHIDRRPVQCVEFRGSLAYAKRVWPTHGGRLDGELRRILGDAADDADESSWDQRTVARLLEFYASSSVERADGTRVLPVSSVRRFLRVFAANATRNDDVVMPAVWLNANASPLVLLTLSPLGFAVPRILWLSGVLMVQTFAGRPMAEYWAQSFAVRARIARNVLLAVQRFTEGVDGFR